jgi:1,4-dihydroxy-2-naphthoate octaprenyltransferase
MDFVSVTAVIISGILAFTAVHAQDFPDVEGDKTTGRMTFPIYAPELSRFFTLFVTIAWSVFLSWFWEVGPISTTLFASFGIYVGLRYYFWRTSEADRRSYLTFNVRILTARPVWHTQKRPFLTMGVLGLAHGGPCASSACQDVRFGVLMMI